MKRRSILVATTALAASMTFGGTAAFAQSKELVYITPSLGVSFWRYVGTGAEAAAVEAGYTLEMLDSNNNAQTQLKNVQDAIARGVAGIVISPTDSSTAPSALNLAAAAGIPVTIADIGTTGGEHVAFIGSDNLGGARGIGDAAGAEMQARGWTDDSYGIIGIPQTRINGQLRTQGFRESMAAVGMTKEVTMSEMRNFTAEESFRFAQDMMTANPDLRVIFVQSDAASVGAARAVKAARRSGDVLIAAFDGTIWFTDPSYGIDQDYEGQKAPSELGSNNLYRVDAGSGEIVAAASDFVQPNGLAFSPDEKFLYVADTGSTHVEDGPKHIRKFEQHSGSLSGGDVVATCEVGLFDGFRVDTNGNIWTSSGEGVHCLTADGHLIGKIHVPETVANVCFGGAKRNRLFICGTTSLYATYLNVSGC